jgi:hypothetical protein
MKLSGVNSLLLGLSVLDHALVQVWSSRGEVVERAQNVDQTRQEHEAHRQDSKKSGDPVVVVPVPLERRDQNLLERAAGVANRFVQEPGAEDECPDAETFYEA